ncbi:MAG TPA: YhjD/YihY/BrkB family envelope integrity protein, partial [Flavisolibacter sp.]
MGRKLSAKGIWKVLKQAFNGFSDDKVVKLSAALAYYTVFSIGPMIIVIIYFAGMIYGREAVQGSIFSEIQGLVGAEAALQIQDMIKSAALN